MIKIAIYGRKGGILKSTLAVNLAYGFSKIGRTLLVDLDSQNDSSLYLSVSKDQYRKTFDDIFDKRQNIGVEDAIIEARENLYILPNGELEAVEALFQSASRLDMILNNKFKHIEAFFDYILFDTAPTRSKVSDSVLLYTDNVILPVQLVGGSGVRSIANVYSVISDLYLNTNIIKAVVPTLLDNTTKDSKENFEYLQYFFKDNDLLTKPIPKRTKMAEAGKLGKSIFEYDQETAGIMLEVFEEVVKRVG